MERTKELLYSTESINPPQPSTPHEGKTRETSGSPSPKETSKRALSSMKLNANPVIGQDFQSALKMRVKKRSGKFEPVDLNKIVSRVMSCCNGLNTVDPLRVATKAISGLYDGASTKELDNLCIRIASLMTSEEPEYSKLAARLLAKFISEEVETLGVRSFSESIAYGNRKGLIADEINHFVAQNHEKLNAAIQPQRNELFEYFGMRTLYDRYLMKDPEQRDVFETPQYFFLRVACGLSQEVDEAIEFYHLISKLEYLPSSPTLFNSATHHSQLSSCYLLDSPQDDLQDIYKKYADVAMLSKWAGGIGLAYHRVRSRGSLIQGTNGHSNGIVPWLKTLDSSVAAVNQGGKRKGAACVYLETWHADIENFLQLRDNTGDESQRTHNLNLANWVPDLFMKRVKQNAMWSLFDPKKTPELVDLYGDAFEKRYEDLEKQGAFEKQVKARDLYGRMMKTLAQTGNGWMTWKDASNLKGNQTGKSKNVIHLSNLCTEILEVTSKDETAVCNLGSINLAKYVKEKEFDFDRLRKNVRLAVRFLDRVIDINFYPIHEAGSSNSRWRPIGLGMMGLQDVFFQMGWAFDDAPAKALSKKISEVVYLEAVKTSCALAKENGAHEAFPETRAAQGQLQFDLWGVEPSLHDEWDAVKNQIKKHGLRNSLMIAIAPTATIASIVGSFESIEPQVSNLFKRETLSGEFVQINRYLVKELRARNLWNDEIRSQIKLSEGSIQGIDAIPEDLRRVYRTAWELPMRSLIDMAAERGAFIDQSASLNLFIESPTIGKLSSMYMYAWEKGIKTTYYLRSRPATKINKVSSAGSSTAKEISPPQDAVSCSLENPESCEACQ